MALGLFAGIPVADCGRSLAWYERLPGCGPSFLPNDVEAVWELGEHRYVFIAVRREHAGHAMHRLLGGAPVEDVSAEGVPAATSPGAR